MHDHDEHDHDHAHAKPSNSPAFVIGIGLNLSFVAIETVFGILSHSVALVADAGHNLSDVLGLALAWGAAFLAKKRPTKRRTYGFRRATILAALTNAVLILVATGGVAWESVRRLSQPAPVSGGVVIAVAAAGVVVNGVSALLFMKGSKRDMNMRGAFLHLVADAAVSAGVVITGVLLVYTHWNLLDPIVSLIVSFFIAVSSWGLLRKAINVSLDAVPDGVDVDAVQEYLAGLPAVASVHDLHIWAMSTTETALTVHLTLRSAELQTKLVHEISAVLHERFQIEHATIQVETEDAGACALAAEGSL